MTDEDRPPAAAPRIGAGRRYVPAILDAVVPGLGHLAAGRARRAALFALPVVLGAGVVAGAMISAGPVRVASLALDDTFLLGLIGLQALLLAWRLAAIGSSLLDPRLPRVRRRDVIPVALLAVIAIGPQAYLGYATNVARDEVNLVFAPATAGSGAWNPVPTSGAGASPEPAASRVPSSAPAVAPAVGSSRVNVLLIGVDAGVGRTTFLTDTLIVASLDPLAGTVSLLSLARDTVDVPLPGGGTFSGKINSLLSYARLHPGEFPGSTGDGHDVLMAAIGTLLNLDIHLYAQVNLGGFVALVNSVGGVDVNVANSFCDPTYHEYGFTNGFAITAGRHHLDGNEALAYARVRKAAGESDFTRQARQQEILSGVRDAVVSGGFLNDPIGFLNAVGQTVETNIPRSMVVALADAARRVGRTKTYRAVITHPLVAPGFDVRGSIQIPDVAAIRALVAQLFPPAGTLPELALAAPPPASTTVAGSGVSSCLPAPTPRPTAKPTPRPAETSGSTPSPMPSSSDASSPGPGPSASPEPSASAVP